MDTARSAAGGFTARQAEAAAVGTAIAACGNAANASRPYCPSVLSLTGVPDACSYGLYVEYVWACLAEVAGGAGPGIAAGEQRVLLLLLLCVTAAADAFGEKLVLSGVFSAVTLSMPLCLWYASAHCSWQLEAHTDAHLYVWHARTTYKQAAC